MKIWLGLLFCCCATVALAQIKVNHHQYREPAGPDAPGRKCGMVDNPVPVDPPVGPQNYYFASVGILGGAILVARNARRSYDRRAS